ncbi:hypothetical protein D3C76_1840320 [compost metagenome]
MAQTKMNRIADIVETRMNAVMTSGTTNSVASPRLMHSTVKARLLIGVERLLSWVK